MMKVSLIYLEGDNKFDEIVIGPSEVSATSGANLGRPLF